MSKKDKKSDESSGLTPTELRRIEVLAIAEKFKTDILGYETNPNALFSCGGEHFIKFRKGKMAVVDDEPVFMVRPSKLMDLSFRSGGHSEFEVFMTDYITQFYGLPPKRQEIQSIVGYYMKFSYNNPQMMANRIAYKDNKIYYDLGDEENTVILVDENGWEVIKETNEVIFKNEIHHVPQVMPISGGDPWKILNYLHITDEDDKKLMLIYVITCFLSQIDRIVLQIQGDHGSGKTAFNKYLSMIIDPTDTKDGLTMGTDPKEIMQNASHRNLCQFDNVDHITNEVNNTLCRCSTGYSGSERTFYTNNGEKIYSFKCNIIINGIKITGAQPDLLDRSIVIDIPHFKKNGENVGPKELMECFEKDRPEILGGIFDTLQKAMAIIEEVNPNIPTAMRMIEFAKWGYAVAEVLGIGGEEFLRIYMNKINRRDIEAVEQSSVGNVMYQYVKDFKSETTIMLLKDLYNSATTFKTKNHIQTYNWPGTPQNFSLNLNKIKPNLRGLGIDINGNRTNAGMLMTIVNNNVTGNETKEETPKSQKLKIPGIESKSEIL